MPVSVVAVNAAIRDSITASTSSSGCNSQHQNDEQSLQNIIVSSAKRVLLTKFEYDEVNNYNHSVLDSLKLKYTVLKPSSNGGKSNNQIADKDTNQNSSSSLSGQHLTRDPNQLPHPKRILFPRENVQIGWKSSGRKWFVGAGMMNVGNTCYLNSTLQALFHVPAVANWLMSDSAHREKCEDETGSQGGCIICAMSKTLIASQSSQSPIRPYLVYTKLSQVCKHLIMGRQEDAHEFLRYLVEAMEKSYLARFRNSKDLDQFSKETTPLNQILGGYLKSAVRCLACGHVSTTFQHFEDLLLDIRKSNSIEEALEGYFSRERLEDMGYKCEACKKKVSATKQFSLERAPISLCIQLKRFSMMGTKLNKHLTIRPHLDLTSYSSKKNQEKLTYKLVAMVTHLGASQHCGHYTAIGLTDAGGYYQFDDSSVRPISLQNVINTNAYIIFYELEDSTQLHRQTSTQISRDHNQIQTKDSSAKLNGQSNNNENIGPSHRQTTSTNSSSSVLHLNSKVISKLENNAGGSSSSGGSFIGPQLPGKSTIFKNENHNNSVSTSTTLTNGGIHISPNGVYVASMPSKLGNSPKKLCTNNNNNNGTSSSSSSSSSGFKSITFQSPNQKLNQSLDSKTAIHMKNGNNQKSPNMNSNKFQNNNNNNNENTTYKFLLNNNNNNNSNSIKSRLETGTESQLKNGEKSPNSINKSTLPSMPKLGESPGHKDNTTKPNSILINRKSQTPTKTGDASQTSELNGYVKTSPASCNNNNNNCNYVVSPVKSLVPYESDDDSNDNESGNESSSKFAVENKLTTSTTTTTETKTTTTTYQKDNRRSSNSNNRQSKFDRTYDSDNDSTSSSSDIVILPPKKMPTPPSPPVIKTKAGFWQVTKVTNNLSATTVQETTNNTTTTTERKNPFATGPSSISSSIFYSNKYNNDKEKKTNNNNNAMTNGCAKQNEDNGTVGQLLKLSHRGYGAPVLNWNGQKTNMEKDVIEDRRADRKRQLADEEENEMDRGRQKKIRIHGPQGRDNPGYNPFQEYQQSQYNQNRRWSNNNNNNNNNVNHNHSNNNRFYNNYRQNQYRNNNFRRNRFHHKPHHQRNNNDGGNNGLYHRRGS